MNDTKNGWKTLTGELAVPTLLLAIAAAGTFVGVIALVVAEVLTLLTGALIQTVVAYVAFTLAHEAAHKNVSGRHGHLSFLDEMVGWTGSLILAAPFSAFRVIHLTHHSHPNDPERDPDYWVAGKNPLFVALRCLSIIPHYYLHFLLGPTSQTRAAKKARLTTVLSLVVLTVAAIALSVAGYHAEIAALWIGPAILASGVLAFFFDWLPHHPHTETERYKDTRVVVFWGFGVLTMGQAYHLIHHLWPRVPFYRYAQCFHRMRPLLEQQGAPIVDLRPTVDRRAPVEYR